MLREGEEHSSTEVPGDVTWAAAPSRTSLRARERASRAAGAELQQPRARNGVAEPRRALPPPLFNTNQTERERVRRQTRRGDEAGLESGSALAHFPARRSSWRLVRMYLKNSYTDQAIAVEGI